MPKKLREAVHECDLTGISSEEYSVSNHVFQSLEKSVVNRRSGLINNLRVVGWSSAVKKTSWQR